MVMAAATNGVNLKGGSRPLFRHLNHLPLLLISALHRFLFRTAIEKENAMDIISNRIIIKIYSPTKATPMYANIVLIFPIPIHPVVVCTIAFSKHDDISSLLLQ
jgi:hypothetical protein